MIIVGSEGQVQGTPSMTRARETGEDPGPIPSRGARAYSALSIVDALFPASQAASASRTELPLGVLLGSSAISHIFAVSRFENRQPGPVAVIAAVGID